MLVSVSSLRVIPAQQGLKTRNCSRLAVHLRLVSQPEFFLPLENRAPEIMLNDQVTDGFAVSLVLVDLRAADRSLHGRIQGKTSLPHDILRIKARIRDPADPEMRNDTGCILARRIADLDAEPQTFYQGQCGTWSLRPECRQRIRGGRVRWQ